jgi:hypothetical protein
MRKLKFRIEQSVFFLVDNCIRDGIIVKRAQGWNGDSYTVAYIGDEGELRLYDLPANRIFLSFREIRKSMEAEYLDHCHLFNGDEATDTFCLILDEQERINGFFDEEASKHDPF